MVTSLNQKAPAGDAALSGFNDVTALTEAKAWL
jgi:hypothetical protein